MVIMDKNKFKQALANFIKDTRLKNNLTQAQLAEKLQIDYKHLSRLENANSNVTFDMFLDICNILNVDILFAFEIIYVNYKNSLGDNSNKNIYETEFTDLSVNKQIFVLDMMKKLKDM